MHASPLQELHRQADLRLVARPEAPALAAPLFFAPPPEEYRAARAGAALLDESEHERLTVRGKDAADFLHRLLANHVKALAVGARNRNCLLSPKGKILFLFECLRQADRFELELPPGTAQPLAEALERFHFSEQVVFEDTSAAFAPLALEGPEARSILTRAFGVSELPSERQTRALHGNGFALTVAALARDRWRIDAGPERVVAAWQALRAAGATPCGLVVRDSLRVEAVRALFGLDLDDNVYPAEARLDDAFALDKGCYVGQEVVAKIDTYGGLNKRLVLLAVEHSDPVARGTKLFRSEDGERRELGLVTSWAYSFALDTGAVLAFVKRKHQEPGTEFELGDGPARARIVAPPG
jgi:folate-binding protein YgfZ